MISSKALFGHLGLLLLCGAMLPLGSVATQSLAPQLASAQTDGAGTTAANARPRLKIHKPHFDWGEVYQGEVVVHEFTVENTGDAELRILDVKPGCQCSIAKQTWKRKLAPGETTVISIAVDTGKLKEPKTYTKSATITTSDPRNVKAKVELSGVVKRVLDLEPRALSFTATAGEPISGEFEMFSPEEGVSVELLELKPRIITIDELTEIEPGRRWKVKFSATPSMKPGSRSDAMKARVRADGVKTLSVPVTVTLKWLDRIQALPGNRMITFKKTETDQLMAGQDTIEKAITITSENSGAKFQLEEVKLLKIDPELCSTEIVEVVPDTTYKVLVKIHKWLPQRFARGAIRIKTTDPNSGPYEFKLFVRYDVNKHTAGR